MYRGVYGYFLQFHPDTLDSQRMQNEQKPLVRLQKVLADRGLASRRKCEEFITRGLIRVEGEVVTKLGTKVAEDAKIEISERVLEEKKKNITLMLHKPAGYVSSVQRTHPDEKIVTDLVDIPERLFPVGRLDKETTGLLLLTNDGSLTNSIIHPRNECEKEYEVLVYKPLLPGQLAQLRNGVRILGGRTLPCTVTQRSSRSFQIIITEGKNRQIRRMCRAVENSVKKLQRVRIKNLRIGSLPLGKWRKLTEKEISDLRG